MKRGLWAALCMLLLVGTAAAEGRRWEGTAAPGRYGEFPESGNFAASNSFPVNSRIEVEHLETGRRTTVFVTRELDETGVLVLLSPDAAREIGLERDAGAEVRVRRVDRAAPPSRTRGPEAALSSDPDRNPLAALSIPPADRAPADRAAADPEVPLVEPEQDAPELEPARAPRALSELPRIPVPDEPSDPVTDPVIAIDEEEFAELAREPSDDEPELGLRPRVSERPSAEDRAPPDEPVSDEAVSDEPVEKEPEAPEVAARRTAPDADAPHLAPSLEFEETVDPGPDAVPADPKPDPDPDVAVEAREEDDVPEFPGPDAVLSLEPSDERPPEGPVTVEPIEPPVDAEPAPAPVPPSEPSEPTVTGVLEPGQYYVQLGAFESREGAGVLVSGLDTRYPSTIVDGRLNGRQVYRVYLGPLSEDEAGAALYTVRRRGYRDAFVTQP